MTAELESELSLDCNLLFLKKIGRRWTTFASAERPRAQPAGPPSLRFRKETRIDYQSIRSRTCHSSGCLAFVQGLQELQELSANSCRALDETGAKEAEGGGRGREGEERGDIESRPSERERERESTYENTARHFLHRLHCLICGYAHCDCVDCDPLAVHFGKRAASEVWAALASG